MSDHTTLEVMQEEAEAYLHGRGEALGTPRPYRTFVAQARLGVSEQEHEAFFRGIVLGVLLRTGRISLSIAVFSALCAAVHPLKGAEREPAIVTWTSGFESIGDAFAGFGDLMMVLAAFATLFLIGCILGDARVLTRSLWLPIGLHAGWIFASGTFSWMARRQMVALPWLGNNLLVGIVPLGLAAVTWILMRLWFKDDRSSQI